MSSLFLLVLFTLILITIELASLVLESTGLPRTIAKFQSISLLTGTGFTTSEAERITKHPIRRKVAETLILFGAFAFALIVALMIHLLNQQFYYEQVLIGILIFMLVFFMFRIRWVKKRMLKRFGRQLRVQTVQELDHLGLEDVLFKVELNTEHQQLFRPLKQLALGARYGVSVIAIARRSQENDARHWIKHPSGSTTLKEGDTLLLLGLKKNIEQIFAEKSLSE